MLSGLAANLSSFEAAGQIWNEFKVFLVSYIGLEKDALHIHGALLLYLIAMVVFRQTRKSRFPWLFVLTIELLNEAADLFNVWEPDAYVWRDSAKDLWNTMLWPTVLLLVGRYTTLFEHRRSEPPGSAAATSEDIP